MVIGCDEPGCPATCPTGQICDMAAGRCVAAPQPCDAVTCPPGQICDPLTGRCLAGEDCLVTGCPQGQTCHIRTQRCTSGPGCLLTGCPADQVCDSGTGRCAALACQRDPDCPAGLVCQDATRCVSGCRLGGRCEVGWICLDPSPGEGSAAIGRCVPGCWQHGDCSHGQRCALPDDGRGAPGVCVEEPSCRSNEECRQDEVCARGRCTRAPCSDKNPCSSEEFCEQDTGDCRPASCDDDALEENDRPADAVLLLAQSYSPLMLCAGDVDLYRVDVPDGQRLDATLRLGSQAADLDLALLDLSGEELTASRTLGATEQVSHTAGERTTLLVAVSGFRGAQGAYALDLSLRRRSCTEDPLSPNHRFQERAALAPDTPRPDLQLCPGAPDWLSFPARLGDGLQVSVELVAALPAGARLELLHLDAHGRQRGATATAGQRRLELAVPLLWPAGEQLLRIQGRGLAEGGIGYTLTADLVHGGLPCPPDAYEPNGRAPQARLLPAGLTTGLSLCPADQDWFLVALPVPGAELSVAWRPATAWSGAPPALRLLSPDDLSQLAEGQPGDHGLLLRAGPRLEGGSYLLGVLAPYDMAPTASYELEVGFALPPPCTEDPLEGAGNDHPETATPLPALMAGTLRLCPASALDLYRLPATGGRPVRVRLAAEPADLERLSLTLLDAAGEKVLGRGRRDVTEGELVATLATPPAAGGLLRVSSPTPSHEGIGYRLAIELAAW